MESSGHKGQTKANPPVRWLFGPAALDERTLELMVGGRPASLERKPLEVLQYLLRHPDEVVTKDALLEAVWPGRILTESVLTKCIAKLREALQDDDQRIIRTLHGHGYRLVVPVRQETSAAKDVITDGGRRLAALMFSDIVGYTTLMGEDEKKAIEARDRHREVVQMHAEQYQGRCVEEVGDEAFLIFPSALDAVQCALAVQKALAEASAFQVRIGVHIGDILERDGRVYGDAVNVTARIRALADPGAVIVSERIWEDVRNHPEIGATALGAKQFKNVNRPVRVYALTTGVTARKRAVIGWRRPALAGALTLVAVGVILSWASMRAERTPVTSVAVLPFVNVSPDPENEYFSDGVTEELINALSNVEGLHVPSRTSVFAYKGKQQDVRQIGRELNVQVVLEGSIRKDLEKLRITAQLINARNGYHIWSQTYERTMNDVFAVQNELARAIVGKLRPQLLPASGQNLVRHGTPNQEAYDAYLRGRYQYYRQDETANRGAIAQLKHAIAIDPDFARAHASLAQAYGHWLTWVAPTDEAAAKEGFVAAERALTLDPGLGEAFLARARLHWTDVGNFRHEAAFKDLKRALELDRGLIDAWLILAAVFFHVGLPEEAERAVNRALELDPEHPGARLQQAVTHLFSSKYEVALAEAEQLPRSFSPVVWYTVTMNALLRLGRTREASARYEEFRRTFPNEGGVTTAVNAVLLATDGQTAVAEREIGRALSAGGSLGHFHHTAYHVGAAYAVMGRTAEAIHWLERSVETGRLSYPSMARDPFLANLRGNQRFEALLEYTRKQMEGFRPLAETIPW